MNKPISVTITDSDWHQLCQSLLTEDGKENAAVLLCGVSETELEVRLLIRRIIPVPLSQYEIREKLHLRIAPSFYNDIISASLDTGLSPVIIHSHPFDGPAQYSPSDNYGESNLLPVLSDLLPNAFVASLLITKTHVTGRRMQRGKFIGLKKLTILGKKVTRIDFGRTIKADKDERYDRQVRAIGQKGQSTIQQLRIGVVGLGGTGSIVVEQLARLGVSNLVLIDDDQVELSNISRLVGSSEDDLGKNKADVIAEHARRIGAASVESISESAIHQQILLKLRDCDLIFSCVDNDRTRAIINRFAHQYLIPAVDLGTRLDAREGHLSNAAGRSTVIGPDATCLRCSHHLNAERIRAESLPAAERYQLKKEGYVMGIDEPAPSVISLNTVVAGLAVTSGINLFTNLTGGDGVTNQLYDATSGFVFTASPVHEKGCDVCDPNDGVKGLGDKQIVSAY